MNFVDGELLTIEAASVWASTYLEREVTSSNISYLIQYGRVRKIEKDGVYVSKADLKKYYESSVGKKEIDWKRRLGQDLNWALSFDHVRESETTKHVHRLHPYKGKFIPQLVEYFLDGHIDEFKKEAFFREGDIVIDPFCGSGTTLIQANELGLHAIGIDISEFNTFISNSKLKQYNLKDVTANAKHILNKITSSQKYTTIQLFEEELNGELAFFNSKYFPTPDYRMQVRNGLIDAKTYGVEKEKDFLETFNNLVNKHEIKLKQESNSSFLDKWYLESVRQEINLAFNEIKKIENKGTKRILALILSRTIRSCRATTHSDLATLKDPMVTTYYCHKHGKICKPLFSIANWFWRYTKDTVARLKEFEGLRTDTEQLCLTGDSRNIDILNELNSRNKKLYELTQTQKIKGVFSSPPYVGLIDYHEQHAYAYDLFGFNRNDNAEIGPLFKGQGLEARKSYVDGISNVLLNTKPYLAEDFDIFLVANDKYNLYPEIAKKSGLTIVNQYKRPVLNRTERDKGAYSEIIFHLKGNDSNVNRQ